MKGGGNASNYLFFLTTSLRYADLCGADNDDDDEDLDDDDDDDQSLESC